MSRKSVVILALLTRQLSYWCLAVAVWFSMKTVEYTILQTEYWSPILSWWWLLSVVPFFVFAVIVGYVTRDITSASIKEQVSNDDVH